MYAVFSYYTIICIDSGNHPVIYFVHLFINVKLKSYGKWSNLYIWMLCWIIIIFPGLDLMMFESEVVHSDSLISNDEAGSKTMCLGK